VEEDTYEKSYKLICILICWLNHSLRDEPNLRPGDSLDKSVSPQKSIVPRNSVYGPSFVHRAVTQSDPLNILECRIQFMVHHLFTTLVIQLRKTSLKSHIS
jgi:hypothetical protein